MIAEITSNSVMMFAFNVGLMYTLGDVDRVTNTPTKVGIIEVFSQATKNKHATNILVFMIAFILFISLINIFASVSRLIWCFATDKGLPFSSFFARVSIMYFSRQHIACPDTDFV